MPNPRVQIFLSYRREDSAAITGRIYDRLSHHFGPASVFTDVDAVPFGVDFRDHIRKLVGQSTIVFAIVGPHWNCLDENQQRRLQHPHDFVRLELETALWYGIPIIPVLIGQTSMPNVESLPETLHGFAYRNAAQIDIGRDFHAHVDRLIRHLESMPAPNEDQTPITRLPAWLIESSLCPRISLKVACGTEQITFEFDAVKNRTIIVGRAPQCDLALLMERTASRKHTMIFYDLKCGWALRDLESALGGVVLNNEFAKDAPLKAGDRIRIGRTEIVVESMMS